MLEAEGVADLMNQQFKSEAAGIEVAADPLIWIDPDIPAPRPVIGRVVGPAERSFIADLAALGYADVANRSGGIGNLCEGDVGDGGK